ncbi:hypothetical protein D3C72_1959290 [compost metagenome]
MVHQRRLQGARGKRQRFVQAIAFRRLAGAIAPHRRVRALGQGEGDTLGYGIHHRGRELAVDGAAQRFQQGRFPHVLVAVDHAYIGGIDVGALRQQRLRKPERLGTLHRGMQCRPPVLFARIRVGALVQQIAERVLVFAVVRNAAHQ